MAIMITGASIMDGAMLMVAANETCPQPQTREHLMALEIAGIENIVIVQNKIDLVSKERAMDSHGEIKAFLNGTIAQNAPIIPVSAHHDVNLDVLIQAIEATIPPPTDPRTSAPSCTWRVLLTSTGPAHAPQNFEAVLSVEASLRANFPKAMKSSSARTKNRGRLEIDTGNRSKPLSAACKVED